MALYAALLYYPEERYWTNPKEAEAVLPEYRKFHAAAIAAGVERGAQALHPVGTATTITVAGGKGGDVMVTDGPYAEAKESLIGFWVVDVASEERAVEIAAQVAHYSRRVELRLVPGGPPEV